MTVFPNPLLILLVLGLGLANSGLLSLCIEEDHAGFEFAWALCCSEDACCGEEPADQAGEGVSRGTDDCQDYLLNSSQDWTPELATDWTDFVAVHATPSSWTFAPVVLWTQPIPPSGAPPPRRDLKTVVIRC